VVERRSSAGRALEAIALIVSFHLRAGVVAVLMIASPLLAVLEDRTPLFLLVVAYGGFALLWSLVPRREPWVDPGVSLDATQVDRARSRPILTGCIEEDLFCLEDVLASPLVG
jgi:hypothetical protein